MTIRSMTWADVFRPPMTITPMDATNLEAALIAESIECLLRATLSCDIVRGETRDIPTAPSSALATAPPDPRRHHTLAQLQDCANALLSITVQLSDTTRQHTRRSANTNAP